MAEASDAIFLPIFLHLSDRMVAFMMAVVGRLYCSLTFLYLAVTAHGRNR
jgi:hypothetical protein